MGNALAPKLEVGNFVDLPYESMMFDLVIDRQSIGHNREEKLHQILNEVHRVLKFDGYLYSNVFGQRTSDLVYAGRVKNNEYSEFSKGAFKNSHMLVAFTPELINTYFEAFDKVDISRLAENIQKILWLKSSSFLPKSAKDENGNSASRIHRP